MCTATSRPGESPSLSSTGPERSNNGFALGQGYTPRTPVFPASSGVSNPSCRAAVRARGQPAWILHSEGLRVSPALPGRQCQGIGPVQKLKELTGL